MKADPEVKMISAEAPILFAKGCDVFITELTMRAWIHAEENKRRTLQRSDIASALAKSDMFDFLIDIVPREEAASHAKRSGAQASGTSNVIQTSATAGHLPPQHANVQHQPQGHQSNQQHPMAPEYGLAANAIGQEQEYRQPSNIYTPQVGPESNPAYGQAQQPMFGDMYGYSSMAPQQVSPLTTQKFLLYASRVGSDIRKMYPVNHRPQDSAGGPDPGHHYSRHDGGEGDADAEGERDYEV